MKLILPENVKKVLDLLAANGYEAFVVGGCVRDAALGRDPSDWDITTNALPLQVKKVFRHTVDTGLQHGTVTVMLGGEGYEVTTYRIDGAYEDARHPSFVTFTPSLVEDLRRRDFTINAMAYNEDKGIVDLFGGLEDLENRVIRCVGDPDARFDEDALRILRAVRFSAQLGFDIELRTRCAIKRHADELRKISKERIRVELMKLLVSDNPGRLRDLYELGLTAQFLPQFDVCMETPQTTPHHAYNVGEHTIRSVENIDPDPILRLTMLLHDFGKPERRMVDKNGKDHFPGHPAESADLALEALKELKFDNKTIDQVVNLVRWHDRRPRHREGSVRRTLWRIGPENFEAYLKVRRADDSAKSNYKREEKAADIIETEAIGHRILKRGDPLSLKELAIGGRELLELGAKGPEVGEILEGALALVLEDPKLNTREFLLEYAKVEHDKRMIMGEEE
ncbi:MAG: CCA tRNA nucleotidyltransferase [Lachnospiraceae bacterium]